MTVLRGNKISLRPWKLGDESSLVKYANNRKISINLRDRFPYPYTTERALEWISTANVKDPLVNFAIDLGGEAIGGTGLEIGEDIFRKSAEIGYWIGEPFWGKGFATEAIHLMTNYGFENLKLVRVWAGVFDFNPASGKALEKAGYLFESLQKSALIKEGKIYDQLVYAITSVAE
jgi:RimJ/RimL family protein N-acetyltransferase